MAGRSGGGVVALLLLAVVVLLVDSRGDDGGRNDGGGSAPAGERVQADVRRVVDGDTIEVALPDGREEDVRYIGVDTPETVKPGEPVQCFGAEASAFNKRLVEGEEVELRFDAERRDHYDRLLAYVYVGDRFVNADLVRRGYARALEIEPNTAHARLFERLERTAGNAGRGLWGRC